MTALFHGGRPWRATTAVPPLASKPPMPSPSRKSKFSAYELEPQSTYRVVVAFADYDNRTHPVGERWKFLRKSFLPYEDGLSLFVEQEGRVTHIRLQCRDEAQNSIVQAFSDFVAEE
jgi:hypothetical protein